jgi:hypothetical protein
MFETLCIGSVLVNWLEKLTNQENFGHSLWMKIQRLTFVEKEKVKRFVRKYDECKLNERELQEAAFYFYGLYPTLFPNYGHVLATINKDTLVNYNEEVYRLSYIKFLTQIEVKGLPRDVDPKFAGKVQKLLLVLDGKNELAGKESE